MWEDILSVGRRRAYFGTMSLNNSIFILPAGVSPMLMSMKTTGRVGAMMVEVEANREIK